MEVSGRYSNPPPQSVDLGQLPVAYPKKVAKSTETRHSKQRQRRLRQEDVEQLRVDYSGGTKVNDIADRYGVARQTVLEHVRRMGLPRRHPRLEPEDVVTATRLYEAGNSLASVGTILGVDAGTVRRVLARSGVSIRDPQGRER